MKLLILVLAAGLLSRVEKKRTEVNLMPGSSRLAGFRASRRRGSTMTTVLCERSRAVTQKRSRRAERVPSFTQHGEKKEHIHFSLIHSACLQDRFK